jgi:histidinol-phosphate aminotransferase
MSKKWVGELLSTGERMASYRVPRTGFTETGGSKLARLDSNENLFVPDSLLHALAQRAIQDLDLRLYPDEQYIDLKEAISEYVNASKDSIVLGCGADQLIFLLTAAVLTTGGACGMLQPTFSMYEVSAGLLRADCIKMELEHGFSFDEQEFLRLTEGRASIVFLCSPNNPTGNAFSEQKIARFAEQTEAILVIDEAYAEFDECGLTHLVDSHDNIIILRTLSKYFGLAGLRVGYCITNRELALTINESIQQPYALGCISAKIATEALRNKDEFKVFSRSMREERNRLFSSLERMEHVTPFPSQANFVLFSTRMGLDDVWRGLLKRGFSIRRIGAVGDRNNCLRVTVGPTSVMRGFLEALEEVMA